MEQAGHEAAKFTQLALEKEQRRSKAKDEKKAFKSQLREEKLRSDQVRGLSAGEDLYKGPSKKRKWSWWAKQSLLRICPRHDSTSGSSVSGDKGSKKNKKKKKEKTSDRVRAEPSAPRVFPEATGEGPGRKQRPLAFTTCVAPKPW